MDIGFSEEQELLRDTARKFLEGQCPMKFVREMMATEDAVTPAFWGKLAENGWLGIAYPEITETQARAIFEAAAEVQKKGIKVKPR